MTPPPRKAVLLLPSHGLEDLPSDCEDAEAEELLAAFSVLCHPSLVSVCSESPKWDRADMPPPIHEGDVVLLPGQASEWLEPAFEEDARQKGASVLRGHTTLSEWVAAVEDATENRPVADITSFLALGMCRLMLERFARRMHVFDELDGFAWFASLHSAAEIAVSETPDDAELKRHLTACFDLLTELRERIHPVAPVLLDSVIFSSEDAETVEEIVAGAGRERPVSLIADMPTWRLACDSSQDLAETVAAAWKDRAVEIVTSEPDDDADGLSATVRPVEWTAEAAADAAKQCRELFERPPRVWGRQSFGLHPQLPQALSLAGFDAALHMSFDIGDYPDTEDAHLLWQGLDRSSVEAFTRLPLPSSRASTMWQFPERLAETVEADHTPGQILLRAAGVDCPWLDLLKTATGFGQVFGEFQTLGEFLVETDSHASLLSPQPREYASALLARLAASRSPDAISQVATSWQRYLQDARSSVLGGLADLIRPAAGVSGFGGEDGPRRFASTTCGDGEANTTRLNPLPFETVFVTKAGPKKVPPCGYLSWPANDGPPSTGKSMVEENTLRNEFLEVHVSPRTGGLQRLLATGKRGNLLSQQVSRRLTEAAEDEYASAEMQEFEVLENGPFSAALRTRGVLVGADVRFVQTFRLQRGQRFARITVDLDGPPPPEGNPWIHYDAVRWAWSGITLGKTMSMDFDPVAASRDRLEAPLFLEIDDDPVVTILFNGHAFHRFSGGRTLDTLLRVHNERATSFEFGVAVGVRNPAELAVEFAATSDDALTVSTAAPASDSAWLLRLDRAGVLVLRVDREPDGDEGQLRTRVRIRETNGSSQPVTLRFFRPVAEAFARDLVGRLTDRLTVTDGGVEVRLRPFQQRDVVVTFA